MKGIKVFFEGDGEVGVEISTRSATKQQNLRKSNQGGVDMRNKDSGIYKLAATVEDSANLNHWSIKRTDIKTIQTRRQA